jgi:two-component system cell cycle response regulator
MNIENTVDIQTNDKTDMTYQPKVLIVDDEPKNIKLLAAILNKSKFQILTANNGQEAIDITLEKLPDIILLDIMMPVMNGYQVTEKLKSDPLTSHIPIILITALDGKESKAKGLELGAEEFLNKPVNSIELLTRVSSMLRLKQYKEQLHIHKKSEEQFSHKTAEPVSPLVENSPDVYQILLVEDNPKDVKIIKTYLNEKNYRLIVTDNGANALDIAQTEKIDLIILDIILPDMDGFNICMQLKKMNLTQNIPVIISTSLNDSESKIKGISAECDDFLTKPIDGNEFKAKIAFYLKKKRNFDALYSNYKTILNSAIVDGLTGLYNHFHFKNSLDLEIKRSTRHNYNLSLMMIDIDNFKKFNDNLGHPVGDVILREVSQVIQDNIRDIDLAARYGGEEFSVILPYATVLNTLTIAERIRTRIENNNFSLKIPSELGRITVSIGIATYPDHVSSANELVIKADEMLYQAKKTGKNKVCLFSYP